MAANIYSESFIFKITYVTNKEGGVVKQHNICKLYVLVSYSFTLCLPPDSN